MSHQNENHDPSKTAVIKPKLATKSSQTNTNEETDVLKVETAMITLEMAKLEVGTGYLVKEVLRLDGQCSIAGVITSAMRSLDHSIKDPQQFMWHRNIKHSMLLTTLQRELKLSLKAFVKLIRTVQQNAKSKVEFPSHQADGIPVPLDFSEVYFKVIETFAAIAMMPLRYKNSLIDASTRFLTVATQWHYLVLEVQHGFGFCVYLAIIGHDGAIWGQTDDSVYGSVNDKKEMWKAVCGNGITMTVGSQVFDVTQRDGNGKVAGTNGSQLCNIFKCKTVFVLSIINDEKEEVNGQYWEKLNGLGF